MPHRKSPSGVAKNFILRNAKFDRLKKESVNIIDADDILNELARGFPDMAPSLAVCPEGFEAIEGLVLDDSRGTGALTPVSTPGRLSIEEFMLFQRKGAFQ